MSEDNVYKCGQVVWVKIREIWWPAEVMARTLAPMVTTPGGKRKRAYCAVRFIDENEILVVKSSRQIHPFECAKKSEFAAKGHALYEKHERLYRKFPTAVHMAEFKTCSRTKDSIFYLQQKHSIVQIAMGLQTFPPSPPRPRDSNSTTTIMDLTPGKQPPNPEDDDAYIQCKQCEFRTKRADTLQIHMKGHKVVVVQSDDDGPSTSRGIRPVGRGDGPSTSRGIRPVGRGDGPSTSGSILPFIRARGRSTSRGIRSMSRGRGRSTSRGFRHDNSDEGRPQTAIRARPMGWSPRPSISRRARRDDSDDEQTPHGPGRRIGNYARKSTSRGVHHDDGRSRSRDDRHHDSDDDETRDTSAKATSRSISVQTPHPGQRCLDPFGDNQVIIIHDDSSSNEEKPLLADLPPYDDESSTEVETEAVAPAVVQPEAADLAPSTASRVASAATQLTASRVAPAVTPQVVPAVHPQTPSRAFAKKSTATRAAHAAARAARAVTTVTASQVTPAVTVTVAPSVAPSETSTLVISSVASAAASRCTIKKPIRSDEIPEELQRSRTEEWVEDEWEEGIDEERLKRTSIYLADTIARNTATTSAGLTASGDRSLEPDDSEPAAKIARTDSTNQGSESEQIADETFLRPTISEDYIPDTAEQAIERELASLEARPAKMARMTPTESTETEQTAANDYMSRVPGPSHQTDTSPTIKGEPVVKKAEPTTPVPSPSTVLKRSPESEGGTSISPNALKTSPKEEKSSEESSPEMPKPFKLSPDSIKEHHSDETPPVSPTEDEALDVNMPSVSHPTQTGPITTTAPVMPSITSEIPSIAAAVSSVASVMPSIASEIPSVAPAVSSVASVMPSIAPEIPSLTPAVSSLAPVVPSISPEVPPAVSSAAPPIPSVAPVILSPSYTERVLKVVTCVASLRFQMTPVPVRSDLFANAPGSVSSSFIRPPIAASSRMEPDSSNLPMETPFAKTSSSLTRESPISEPGSASSVPQTSARASTLSDTELSTPTLTPRPEPENLQPTQQESTVRLDEPQVLRHTSSEACTQPHTSGATTTTTAGTAQAPASEPSTSSQIRTASALSTEEPSSSTQEDAIVDLTHESPPKDQPAISARSDSKNNSPVDRPPTLAELSIPQLANDFVDLTYDSPTDSAQPSRPVEVSQEPSVASTSTKSTSQPVGERRPIRRSLSVEIIDVESAPETQPSTSTGLTSQARRVQRTRSGGLKSNQNLRANLDDVRKMLDYSRIDETEESSTSQIQQSAETSAEGTSQPSKKVVTAIDTTIDNMREGTSPPLDDIVDELMMPHVSSASDSSHEQICRKIFSGCKHTQQEHNNTKQDPNKRLIIKRRLSNFIQCFYKKIILNNKVEAPLPRKKVRKLLINAIIIFREELYIREPQLKPNNTYTFEPCCKEHAKEELDAVDSTNNIKENPSPTAELKQSLTPDLNGKVEALSSTSNIGEDRLAVTDIASEKNQSQVEENTVLKTPTDEMPLAEAVNRSSIGHEHTKKVPTSTAEKNIQRDTKKEVAEKVKQRTSKQSNESGDSISENKKSEEVLPVNVSPTDSDERSDAIVSRGKEDLAQSSAEECFREKSKSPTDSDLGSVKQTLTDSSTLAEPEKEKEESSVELSSRKLSLRSRIRGGKISYSSDEKETTKDLSAELTTLAEKQIDCSSAEPSNKVDSIKESAENLNLTDPSVGEEPMNKLSRRKLRRGRSSTRTPHKSPEPTIAERPTEKEQSSIQSPSKTEPEKEESTELRTPQSTEKREKSPSIKLSEVKDTNTKDQSESKKLLMKPSESNIDLASDKEDSVPTSTTKEIPTSSEYSSVEMCGADLSNTDSWETSSSSSPTLAEICRREKREHTLPLLKLKLRKLSMSELIAKSTEEMNSKKVGDRKKVKRPTKLWAASAVENHSAEKKQTVVCSSVTVGPEAQKGKRNRGKTTTDEMPIEKRLSSDRKTKRFLRSSSPSEEFATEKCFLSESVEGSRRMKRSLRSTSPLEKMSTEKDRSSEPVKEVQKSTSPAREKSVEKDRLSEPVKEPRESTSPVEEPRKLTSPVVLVEKDLSSKPEEEPVKEVSVEKDSASKPEEVSVETNCSFEPLKEPQKSASPTEEISVEKDPSESQAEPQALGSSPEEDSVEKDLSDEPVEGPRTSTSPLGEVSIEKDLLCEPMEGPRMTRRSLHSRSLHSTSPLEESSNEQHLSFESMEGSQGTTRSLRSASLSEDVSVEKDSSSSEAVKESKPPTEVKKPEKFTPTAEEVSVEKDSASQSEDGRHVSTLSPEKDSIEKDLSVEPVEGSRMSTSPQEEISFENDLSPEPMERPRASSSPAEDVSVEKDPSSELEELEGSRRTNETSSPQEVSIEKNPSSEPVEKTSATTSLSEEISIEKDRSTEPIEKSRRTKRYLWSASPSEEVSVQKDPTSEQSRASPLTGVATEKTVSSSTAEEPRTTKRSLRSTSSPENVSNKNQLSSEPVEESSPSEENDVLSERLRRPKRFLRSSSPQEEVFIDKSLPSESVERSRTMRRYLRSSSPSEGESVEKNFSPERVAAPRRTRSSLRSSSPAEEVSLKTFLTADKLCSPSTTSNLAGEPTRRKRSPRFCHESSAKEGTSAEQPVVSTSDDRPQRGRRFSRLPTRKVSSVKSAPQEEEPNVAVEDSTKAESGRGWPASNESPIKSDSSYAESNFYISIEHPLGDRGSRTTSPSVETPIKSPDLAKEQSASVKKKQRKTRYKRSTKSNVTSTKSPVTEETPTASEEMPIAAEETVTALEETPDAAEDVPTTLTPIASPTSLDAPIESYASEETPIESLESKESPIESLALEQTPPESEGTTGELEKTPNESLASEETSNESLGSEESLIGSLASTDNQSVDEELEKSLLLEESSAEQPTTECNTSALEKESQKARPSSRLTEQSSRESENKEHLYAFKGSFMHSKEPTAETNSSSAEQPEDISQISASAFEESQIETCTSSEPLNSSVKGLRNGKRRQKSPEPKESSSKKAFRPEQPDSACSPSTPVEEESNEKPSPIPFEESSMQSASEGLTSERESPTDNIPLAMLRSLQFAKKNEEEVKANLNPPATAPPVEIEKPKPSTTTVSEPPKTVTKSSLSCFDFQEEEDVDSDALTSMSKFKRKYISSERNHEREIRPKTPEAQKFEMELKDKLLTDEIESLLRTTEPSSSSSAVRSLPIKERGKRIFKSRNRRVENENSTSVSTTTTTPPQIRTPLPPRKYFERRERLTQETDKPATTIQEENKPSSSPHPLPHIEEPPTVEKPRDMVYNVTNSEEEIVGRVVFSPAEVYAPSAECSTHSPAEVYDPSTHSPDNKDSQVSSTGIDVFAGSNESTANPCIVQGDQIYSVQSHLQLPQGDLCEMDEGQNRVWSTEEDGQTQYMTFQGLRQGPDGKIHVYHFVKKNSENVPTMDLNYEIASDYDLITTEVTSIVDDIACAEETTDVVEDISKENQMIDTVMEPCQVVTCDEDGEILNENIEVMTCNEDEEILNENIEVMTCNEDGVILNENICIDGNDIPFCTNEDVINDSLEQAPPFDVEPEDGHYNLKEPEQPTTQEIRESPTDESNLGPAETVQMCEEESKQMTELSGSSDENTSTMMSDADAEFGSPTSFLDEERILKAGGQRSATPASNNENSAICRSQKEPMAVETTSRITRSQVRAGKVDRQLIIQSLNFDPQESLSSDIGGQEVSKGKIETLQESKSTMSSESMKESAALEENQTKVGHIIQEDDEGIPVDEDNILEVYSDFEDSEEEEEICSPPIEPLLDEDGEFPGTFSSTNDESVKSPSSQDKIGRQRIVVKGSDLLKYAENSRRKKEEAAAALAQQRETQAKQDDSTASEKTDCDEEVIVGSENSDLTSGYYTISQETDTKLILNKYEDDPKSNVIVEKPEIAGEELCAAEALLLIPNQPTSNLENSYETSASPPEIENTLEDSQKTKEGMLFATEASEVTVVTTESLTTKVVKRMRWKTTPRKCDIDEQSNKYTGQKKQKLSHESNIGSERTLRSFKRMCSETPHYAIVKEVESTVSLLTKDPAMLSGIAGKTPPVTRIDVNVENPLTSQMGMCSKRCLEDQIPSFKLMRQPQTEAEAEAAERETIAQIKSLCPQVEVRRRLSIDEKRSSSTTTSTQPMTIKPQIINQKILCAAGNNKPIFTLTPRNPEECQFDISSMPMILSNDTSLNEKLHLVITPPSNPKILKQLQNQQLLQMNAVGSLSSPSVSSPAPGIPLQRPSNVQLNAVAALNSPSVSLQASGIPPQRPSNVQLNAAVHNSPSVSSPAPGISQQRPSNIQLNAVAAINSPSVSLQASGIPLQKPSNVRTKLTPLRKQLQEQQKQQQQQQQQLQKQQQQQLQQQQQQQQLQQQQHQQQQQQQQQLIHQQAIESQFQLQHINHQNPQQQYHQQHHQLQFQQQMEFHQPQQRQQQQLLRPQQQQQPQHQLQAQQQQQIANQRQQQQPQRHHQQQYNQQHQFQQQFQKHHQNQIQQKMQEEQKILHQQQVLLQQQVQMQAQTSSTSAGTQIGVDNRGKKYVIIKAPPNNPEIVQHKVEPVNKKKQKKLPNFQPNLKLLTNTKPQMTTMLPPMQSSLPHIPPQTQHQHNLMNTCDTFLNTTPVTPPHKGQRGRPRKKAAEAALNNKTPINATPAKKKKYNAKNCNNRTAELPHEQRTRGAKKKENMMIYSSTDPHLCTSNTNANEFLSMQVYKNSQHLPFLENANSTVVSSTTNLQHHQLNHMPHLSTGSRIQQSDALNKGYAVPSIPVPGFDPSYLLCEVIDNKFRELSPKPLYLSPDQSKFIEIPGEFVSDIHRRLTECQRQTTTDPGIMEVITTTVEEVRVIQVKQKSTQNLMQGKHTQLSMQEQASALLDLQEQIVQERIAQEKLAQEHLVHNQLAQAQLMEEQLAQEQLVQEHLVQDQFVQEQIVQDDIVQEQIVQEEVVVHEQMAVDEQTIHEGELVMNEQHFVQEQAMEQFCEGEHGRLAVSEQEQEQGQTILVDKVTNPMLLGVDGSVFYFNGNRYISLAVPNNENNGDGDGVIALTDSVCQQILCTVGPDGSLQPVENSLQSGESSGNILQAALDQSGLSSDRELLNAGNLYQVDTPEVVQYVADADLVFQPVVQSPITAQTQDTSVLLNQSPKMSTVEVPSTHPRVKLPSPATLDDCLNVIGVCTRSPAVPASLELPITAVSSPSIMSKTRTPTPGTIVMDEIIATGLCHHPDITSISPTMGSNEEQLTNYEFLDADNINNVHEELVIESMGEYSVVSSACNFDEPGR